jgi:hypothetical protein
VGLGTGVAGALVQSKAGVGNPCLHPIDQSLRKLTGL